MIKSALFFSFLVLFTKSLSCFFLPSETGELNILSGENQKYPRKSDSLVKILVMAAETKNSNVNAQKRRRRGRKGRNSEKDFDKRGENKQIHSNSQQYRPHKSLLIHLTEQTPCWYECGRHTPGRDDTIFSIKKLPSSGDKNRKIQNNPVKLTQKYRTLADQIFQQEMSLFNDSNSGGGSDERWVESTMNRGTLKDRVAAMSVVVTSNPVHKLHALDMLLNLAGVSTSEVRGASQPNARVSQLAAEALVDLFTNTLIPSNRKLFNLDSRPLFLYENNNDQINSPSNKEKKSQKEKGVASSQKTLSPRVLLLWRYEEVIKQKYNSFLLHYVGKTLSEASLDLNKSFALKTAANLFRDLPEGEQILLGMMVNKIGDPSRKIAAAAGHQLRQILSQHPQMVYIIAREVRYKSDLWTISLFFTRITHSYSKHSCSMTFQNSNNNLIGSTISTSSSSFF